MKKLLVILLCSVIFVGCTIDGEPRESRYDRACKNLSSNYSYLMHKYPTGWGGSLVIYCRDGEGNIYEIGNQDAKPE